LLRRHGPPRARGARPPCGRQPGRLPRGRPARRRGAGRAARGGRACPGSPRCRARIPAMTETPGPRPSLLILSYSHLYRDARILRQIATFSDVYDITTMGYGPRPEGVQAHVEIPGDIIYWKVNRPLVMARFFQTAYDRAAITRYVREKLRPGQFDLILANDVHAVPVAITLKPRRGVHADLHEYTTRQQEEMWRYRTFLAPYYGYLIRRWVRQADSVTTVGVALAQEYQREFGVDCRAACYAPSRADLPAGAGGPA